MTWSGTIIWYTQLLVVAVVNVCLWLWVGWWLRHRGSCEPPPEANPYAGIDPALAAMPPGWRRNYKSAVSQMRREGLLSFLRPQPEPSLQRYRWTQYRLSGVYIWVAVERSITPRNTLCRLTLLDTRVGCAGIGRALATVAELCFVGQWALLVLLLADRLQVPKARPFAWACLLVIGVAECFSWASTITTNYIWGAVEESLWAVSAIIFKAGTVLCYPAAAAIHNLQFKIVLGIGGALCYTIYMAVWNVPPYIARYKEAVDDGQDFLSFHEGLCCDVWRYVVNRTDGAWEHERVWQSLYFSVACWTSLMQVVYPNWRPAKTQRTAGAAVELHAGEHMATATTTAASDDGSRLTAARTIKV